MLLHQSASTSPCRTSVGLRYGDGSTSCSTEEARQAAAASWVCCVMTALRLAVFVCVGLCASWAGSASSRARPLSSRPRLSVRTSNRPSREFAVQHPNRVGAAISPTSGHKVAGIFWPWCWICTAGERLGASHQADAERVIKALGMAYEQRGQPQQGLLHSDPVRQTPVSATAIALPDLTEYGSLGERLR